MEENKTSFFSGNRNSPVRLALAGNPNCGKTTLFNALTGSNQYVGNWPGVTVSRKTGRSLWGNSELTDLPGIYSLSPYSMEEITARDYILDENPDGIINIVDGTNLERNLYLTLQLMELGKPVILAVNMMDEVEKKGWRLDCRALSDALGIPAIPVTARKGVNVKHLLETAEQASRRKIPAPPPRYDSAAEAAKREILSLLESCGSPASPADFWAGKLLEGDAGARKKFGFSPGEQKKLEEACSRYEKTSLYGDRETMLADSRYRLIEAVARKCLKKAPSGRVTVTERIDRVAMGRFTAFPLFLASMFLMFSVTFGPVGKGLSLGVRLIFSRGIIPLVRSLLDWADAPFWCYGLLLDAVIGGVSGIIVFLPQVALLFFCLSLLEDSGYMARAAFLMDRLLGKIGLSGKAFISMLMGFGCTTPAIMAARTLEREKDRKMTMMLLPFMSCSARLPIYAVFAGAFFPEHQGLTVFLLYLGGAVVAVLLGVLLKGTLFRGDSAPFVMELPPYRMPLISSVALHVWQKVKGFLIKAGTLIFSMSVVIWGLRNFAFPFQIAGSPEQSMLGRLGAFFAPALSPLGFGSWQAAVALLTGLIAKESVVSTLTILYAAGNTALLPAALESVFTPASAAAFLVFCLLYMPCISAFATLVREMNSLRWAAGTAALSTGAAWICSFLTGQTGKLIWGDARVTSAALPAVSAGGGGGGTGTGAAFVCVVLILAAGILFLRSVWGASRGRCCHGCEGCRMEGRCPSRKE